MKNRKKITVGLLAHVDSGKTTLAEALFLNGGLLRQPGRVDHRDAYLDTDPLEKKRGITIYSKVGRMSWGMTDFTFIDTPGHIDFAPEMERALRVIDLAVLLISGPDGAVGYSLSLWRMLQHYQIPAFLFVNKMDQPGTDKAAILRQLKKELGGGLVDFSGPEEERKEEIALLSDSLLASYLDRGEVEEGDIRKLVADRRLTPLYFGSALKNQGVKELLEGLDRYAPVPQWGEDFRALIYNKSFDRGVELTQLRVQGGSLHVRQPLGQGKVQQIRLYSGSSYQLVQEAGAGEVVAVTGLDQLSIGRIVGKEREEALPPPLMQPVFRYQLSYEGEGDGKKQLYQAYLYLQKLARAFPELQPDFDAENNRLFLSLMGEVAKEVLGQKLEEAGFSLSFRLGQVLYRETIAGEAVGVGHYEPLSHYAEVQLRISALLRGSGVRFESLVSTDELPLPYQKSIRDTLLHTEIPGVLMGRPVTDVQYSLLAGRFMLGETEGGDFRQASLRAARNGLRYAHSLLLEPYYHFHIRLPLEKSGRILQDLSRLGIQAKQATREDWAIFEGRGAVSSLAPYFAGLPSSFQGRGELSFEVDGYGSCREQEGILRNYPYDPEADPDFPAGSIFLSHGAACYVPWYEVKELAHTELVRWGEEEAEETEPQPGKRSRPSRPLSEEEVRQILYASSHANENPKKQAKKREERERRKKRQEAQERADRKRGGNQGSQLDSSKPSYLLVDGYNILFAWPETRELAEENLGNARQRLNEMLDEYAAFFEGRLILVYDAYKDPKPFREVQSYGRIKLVFTRQAETADAYIQLAAKDYSRHYQVFVASSDNTEQLIVRSQGAVVWSARDLYQAVKKEKKGLMDQYNRMKTEDLKQKLWEEEE